MINLSRLSTILDISMDFSRARTRLRSCLAPLLSTLREESVTVFLSSNK